jgi:hypothetical protein
MREQNAPQNAHDVMAALVTAVAGRRLASR